MIQEQLVDYISSQMKSGVSRESIKSTLVTAGWAAADIEDTLKKVEAISMAQPITTPPGGSMPASATPKMVSYPVGNDQPTIKVSDLISASDAAVTVKPVSGGTMNPKDLAKKNTVALSSKAGGAQQPMPAGATEYPPRDMASAPHGSRKGLVIESVLGLLVIVLGALAGFFYWQNSTLAGKVASLGTQSSGVSSQVAMLQQQAIASTTALTAQVVQLTSEMQELKTELSFFAVAPASASVAGAASSASSTASSTVAAPTQLTASVSGIISGGGKAVFSITTVYGARIYVANSKDAKVIAALTPLVNGNTAQVMGTYIQGSDALTVTGVNGAAL